MSDEVERRVIPVVDAELRVDQSSGTLKIRGYAARFNTLSQDLGGFREQILPGAFQRALKAGADCRALVNHNPDLILGRTKSGTLTLEEDAVGLRFEVAPSGSELASHYIEAIRRGDIDGCSFAFTVAKGGQKWQRAETAGEPEIRTISEIGELYDVGPVTYPAYPDTTVAVRALDRIRTQAEQGKRAAMAQRERRLRLHRADA